MSSSDLITGIVVIVVVMLWSRWRFFYIRDRYANEDPEHPKKLSKRYVKIDFYSESLVIALSATLCAIVFVVFLHSENLSLPSSQGIGEVGDFIGGLTNPLLSFAALIVLLRATTIQTRITKVQSDNQELISFRDEFYLLLKNVENKSQKMRPEYLAQLSFSLKKARATLINHGCNDFVHEALSRKVVVKLIEFGIFEKFATSVRMAMRHVIASKPADMYMYGIIIRDSMSDSERIVFLTWAYYYWSDAKHWFKEFHDADGKITSCEFTRGLKSEDFISDEVFKFFDK